jgi:hypothetical protein
MTAITINGISIDPTAPRPTLAALSLDHATAKSSDYVLVQTRTPLDRLQRAQLAKTGARIMESVPGGAFICHFPGTGLARLRALPFVAWADLYPGVVKVAPSLRKLSPRPGGVEAGVAALSMPASLDATKVTVDVVLHRNAKASAVAKRVAAAAHLHMSDVKVAGQKIRMTLKMRRLTDVAALDAVRHVEQVFPRKLANNIARQILRVPGKSAASGAEGKGEIVAIADTGFDKGSTSDVHPAFKGRVKKLYALGRAGKKNDPDGHGTHVAGSVLGDGKSRIVGPIRGSAPAAKLVLQSVLDSRGGLGGLPDDLNELFRPPYATDKARVHSNSWGTPGNPGVYDQQAHEVDDFMYRHRDMRSGQRGPRWQRQWSDRSQLGHATRDGEELPDHRREREQAAGDVRYVRAGLAR